MDEIKKTCYNCVYRGQVLGSAHSNCSFNFQKAGVEIPKGDQHGVRSGWYNFPIDFDPVWMTKPCPAFSTEKNNEMVIEPVMSLIQILRR